MATALLFPGQGSQFVGMGKDLAQAFPEARLVFEEADDLLRISLSRLMWEGPAEELVLTRNAQPALLVHSIAVLRVLGEGTPGLVGMAAGHSLGEFTAYTAAGTLSFVAALKAVRARGELMYAAGVEHPGTMAAVLGLDDSTVADICRQVQEMGKVCVPANYNAPGQVVVSGEVAGVEEAMTLARQAGATRVLRLSVSGAFHSPLMAPAREGLRVALENLDFSDPSYPVYSNVTAAPVREGERARALLVEQLTSPVRWAESLRNMVQQGAERFIELGAGSVLSGLAKRVVPNVPCFSVGTPKDLDRLGG